MALEWPASEARRPFWCTGSPSPRRLVNNIGKGNGETCPQTGHLRRSCPTREATQRVFFRSSFRETAEAMARRKRAGGSAGGRRPRIAKHQVSKSPYFMQPGKRGVFVVLHRACGNRVVPKVCGEMPSRTHAKMLITQLERAESVVKDLFLEATDDGIEALEAVLAACREEVLRRGPRVHEGGGGEGGGSEQGGESGGRPPGEIGRA